MDEEDMIQSIMFKIEQIFILKHNGEYSLKDTEIPSILCAHLMMFLSTVIQYMAYYKKKRVFFCPLLNQKIDPRLHRGSRSSTMGSSILNSNSNSEVKHFGVTSPISTLSQRPDELEKTKELEKTLFKNNLFESDEELAHRTMVSSVLAYEDTPFSAKDFFRMLKDHESLIPVRSIYQKFIECLLNMDSTKPSVPKDHDDKVSKESMKRLKMS